MYGPLALAWAVQGAVQDYHESGDPRDLIPYYHAAKHRDPIAMSVGAYLTIMAFATPAKEGSLSWGWRLMKMRGYMNMASFVTNPVTLMLGSAALGSYSQHQLMSQSGAGVRGTAMGVSPSMHGDWIFNVPEDSNLMRFYRHVRA